MPEDKKAKGSDKKIKEALHHSEHSIDLPKKDKSKKVWIVLFVITLIALIGLGVFGYIKIKNDNKKIKDQQAQIDDLNNKKKTLEDTVAAAATAVTQVVTSNYLEVKELGFKLPLTSDIKDLQYFVNDKTAFFSTSSLQSSAWPSANNKAELFCSLGSMPLGTISKFANANEAGPTRQKALSGFVLGYAGPQAACSNNQATGDLETKQRAALEAAFNKAEKL